MGYNKSRDIRRWEMRKMKVAGLSIEEAYSDEENGLSPDLVYGENLCGFLGDKALDSTQKKRVEVEKPGTEISAIAKRGSVFLSEHPRSHTIPPMQGGPAKRTQKKLPIESFRHGLMEFIEKHQVTVLVGEAGSGKSTQVPKYLYLEGYGNRGMIGCTQPRRAAATSLASILEKDMGPVVGYSIRFDSTTTHSTKIRYMTEGVLLQELLSDKLLRKYSVVILDEAHERSANLDISIGLLKSTLKERNDMKLIIMSATIEAQRFCDYFGCSAFEIEGRTYPVDIRYLSMNVDDYVEWAVKKILHIHENCEEGDILVFMTGRDDVEGVVGIVNYWARSKYLTEGGKEDMDAGLKAIPFYSQLSEEMQSKVFQIEKSARKCIVSTNIAETSLTIPNIGYVIDTGLQKVSVYNHDTGESLVTVPVSRANADQRAGRAGRTRPGTCYRMYTLSTYENDLLASPVPEIQRANIHEVVLLLLKHGIRDVFEFDFIDSPSAELTRSALLLLYRLGAVCHKGLLTREGEDMSELRLEPPLAKMVLNSSKYGVVSEMVTIASMLSVYGIFYEGFDKSSHLCHQGCDFMTLLNIFNEFITQKNGNEWCYRMKINEDALRKAMEIRKTTLVSLQEKGVQISSNRSPSRIQRCIVSSIYYNIAKKKDKKYVCLSNFQVCKIHPSSTLKDGTSQYVLFYRHISTKAEYMYCCSDISPRVVLEEAGKYYRDRNAPLSTWKGPIHDCITNEANGKGVSAHDVSRIPEPKPRPVTRNRLVLDEDLYDRFEKWSGSEDCEEPIELPKRTRRPRL
ncbi:HrpA-like helicase [Encephalitozoon hellem ATCC 50504]|uniref:RNA helicase n=1 Tax=Encephalitozoon hellem TaxID=27973 RepID=A0A9Q9C4C1_ENCHE|nr:HrpA-like helicase [Encephalitozoon hellem ATCC 50504]AFM98909.1 HrpA-like helicase [Encephalitozoon hellem ATCC 50504]UTX43921.1 RNA helicase [Encephalitozoon hellem]WEL39405.1 RNA helicase [Encephalitozoon hellem]|eukprot:XP_003887890.1 HrpA-like helicase [Encephalitozoon hellem ATCC 50504]